MSRLKPATRPESAPSHPTSAAAPPPNAASLHRIAAAAGRSLPAALPPRDRQTTLVNIKVGIDLADALAERATREGVTQKQLICRALEAYGLPVDPLDLQDRTRRRLRGV